MKKFILGRFPRIRGVIILLFVLAITPAFVAAWIAFQQSAVQVRDAKVGDFEEVLGDNLELLNLNLHSDRIRAALVSRQEISWPQSSDQGGNVQPPEDCFKQYGDPRNPKRFEICAAYFKNSADRTVDHLYFYIDYCTRDLGRRDADDDFELTLTTPEGRKSWWIVVAEDRPPITRQESKNGPLDSRVRGEFWDPVAASQRCPDSTPKQRLRLRLNACAALPGSSYCDRAIAGTEFDDWIHSVLIDFTRHNDDQRRVIDTASTTGSSRGPAVNRLNNILDPGEAMYFGACPPGVSCDCFQGATSYLNSTTFEGAGESGALYSLTGAVLGRQPSNYCSVSPQGTWLQYERSGELNLATSAAYLRSMLPVVAYSVLALLLAVFVVYSLLGRPLMSLTSGLIRSRNWDSETPIDIPYVSARHEIGTVARAFRYVLLRIRRQLQRERKLTNELRLKSERDRDINSIIAHEIKSPFHNLKNKYPDNLDIARIDTALEAILRIDQAVQSSSDEVLVVNIREYLSEYIEHKEDVNNIDLAAQLDMDVELRGMLLWLVLDNIIANADRFRSDPDAPIEISLEPGEEGCRVLISNDGPPIPADKMEAIFNLRYTDSKRARKNGSDNQGIGLFISRHYMRMLGGDLRVLDDSSGVTFEISLRRHH